MRFTFGQFDDYEKLIPTIIKPLKAHEMHRGIEDFFTLIDEHGHNNYDEVDDIETIEEISRGIGCEAFPMHHEDDIDACSNEFVELFIHYNKQIKESAPTIGSPVSYSFNGDSYPCGHIERVTPGGMYVTDEGTKFRRHKGYPRSYYRVGCKQWGLIAGHHNDRNPHF